MKKTLLKTTLSLLLCFVFVNVFSQQQKTSPPNYKQIEQNIKNSSSPLFYPTLLERYMEGDSSLALDEKRHLYFGFIYQPSYAPYGRSPYSDSINLLLRKDELSDKEWAKIVNWSDLALQKFPFDTRILQRKGLALYKLGLNEGKDYNKTMNQYHAIVDAIFSTGDGTDEKNAMHVIVISHEYEIVSLLDFTSKGQALLSKNDRKYDRILLEDNVNDVKELYFDITASFNSLSFGISKDAKKEKGVKKDKKKNKKN